MGSTNRLNSGIIELDFYEQLRREAGTVFMANDIEKEIARSISLVDVMSSEQAGLLRPEQVEALLRISTLLNSDLNAGRILRDVLLQVCALFRADRAAVFLREKLPTPTENPSEPGEARKLDIGKIVCAASTGLSQEYIDNIARFYERKEFHELQRIQQPLFFENARADTRLNGVREMNRREGFYTMLTLPMMYHDVLIGVIVLYHNQAHHYSEQETRILGVFANQAALAITNARLYEQARRRVRDAAQLAEAGRLFNASLKTGEVLHRVGRVLGNMVGNTALIYIVQEGGDQAIPVAFYSTAEKDGAVQLESPVKTGQPVIKLGAGVIGKALQSNVPFLLADKVEIVRVIPFVRPEDGVSSLICVPLRTRGRTIGALISYQVGYDQPTRVLDEENLGLAQALADRAAVAIENARMYEAEKREQRMKDEFLTLVSHELNTPLTNVKGYNFLLSKKLDDALARSGIPNRALEGLRHYTDVIGGQVERLERLITDLSKLPLIESGQLELTLSSSLLLPLVKTEIEQIERSLKTPTGATPRHSFDVYERMPGLKALIDQPAFSRIMQILLANAIKYSPDGGVIKIELTESGLKQVKVTVTDSGIGISEQDLPHIFERFYKASNSSGRANGLGLGLYIAASFAELMNGTLSASSPGEGKGSTFTLKLDRAS
jgi:signal transduction histidine kinase